MQFIFDTENQRWQNSINSGSTYWQMFELSNEENEGWNVKLIFYTSMEVVKVLINSVQGIWASYCKSANEDNVYGWK